MAEEVGSIRYTTEVDVSDTLTAEKQLDTATNKMVQDFNKVDGASKKLGTQMTKTSKAVSAGVGGMGRKAGQAGIQFQQLIGQLQGGQDAMLALSAQSADLGFVLGAPLVGAIVGIGASLIGMAAAFGQVEVDMKSTSDIAKELVGDFSKLDAESQKLAKGVLVFNIAKQEKALKSLKDEQKEYLTSLKLFTSTEEASEKYKEYTANILSLELALKESKESLNSLGKSTTDYTTVINDQQQSIGDLITNTVHLGNTYGFNARELAVYEAELLGANETQLAALNLAFDSVEAKQAEAEATKKQVAAENELKRAKEQAGTFAGGIVKRGMTQEEKLAAELIKLEELREKELLSLTQFEEAKTAITQQQADAREKVLQDEAKATQAAQAAITGAVLGAISATTSALLSGMDEQSGAYKALFAIQKATQVAMTIANAETAAAAVTAREAPILGLGSVAAGNLVRGLGYASAGIIAGTAIAGGRQFGGPVNAGSAYRVGEAGPEIFSSGGKNFMIPGENGKVIANDDISGGGFSQNVEIINNTPANVSTQSSSDGTQMKIFINEVARQISDNQGAIPRALRSGSNYQPKANR